ncbi:MAG TPA: hypothetical protein VNA23_10985, partial [Anaerolineales bacterium]|nr:hypothetical protein [Anaerolineales bacterium]
VIVIADYIQRRVLGLPPFEGDGSTQFVAPPEKLNPPRREWRRKKVRPQLDKELSLPMQTAVPDSPEAASTLTSESPPQQDPAREKTTE